MGRTDVSYGRLYAGSAANGRGDNPRVAKTDGDDDGLRLAQLNFRLAQAVLRAEGAGGCRYHRTSGGLWRVAGLASGAGQPSAS